MNNDLISRGALKEAFMAWKAMDEYYHNKSKNIPFAEAFAIIDEEPAIIQVDKELTINGEHPLPLIVSDIVYVGKPPTPGRWIHSAAKKYYAICSLCSYESIIWNADFCPGCGARMQKDENKEE